MPNLVPLVEIDLDKPRHLRLDLNAMCEFERVSGKSIAEIGNSLRDIRIMLWAALVHEDPDLTEEGVGSFIHAGNLSLVNAALSQAFMVAMPEPVPGVAPPKNRRRSTGSNSGPSGATTSD